MILKSISNLKADVLESINCTNPIQSILLSITATTTTQPTEATILEMVTALKDIKVNVTYNNEGRTTDIYRQVPLNQLIELNQCFVNNTKVKVTSVTADQVTTYTIKLNSRIMLTQAGAILLDHNRNIYIELTGKVTTTLTTLSMVINSVSDSFFTEQVFQLDYLQPVVGRHSIPLAVYSHLFATNTYYDNVRLKTGNDTQVELSASEVEIMSALEDNMYYNIDGKLISNTNLHYFGIHGIQEMEINVTDSAFKMYLLKLQTLK